MVRVVMLIERPRAFKAIEKLLREHRVVALLGARQTGKSTLAREILRRRRGPTAFFDLEDAADLARLSEPRWALGALHGLVVIDEVQRRPELFPTLRVLADRPRAPRFLLLGSAAPQLLRQSSESLAGRIAYARLEGLALDEVGPERLRRLWLRGGFPLAFRAGSHDASFSWRRQFLRTFLERDVPQLGFRVPALALERLWNMLAHWHGQTMNASELGRSLGVTEPTVRHHLDVLAGGFMIRVLKPWHENLAKRQVKSPKLYVADSGLLHALLAIRTEDELLRHPKVGASWEGFALSQVLTRLGAEPEESYFWATHQGAELDLLVVRGRRRLGFEMKLTDAPTVTPSMRIALAELRLDSLDVIHAGSETFPLAERIRAVSLSRLGDDLSPLG